MDSVMNCINYTSSSDNCPKNITARVALSDGSSNSLRKGNKSSTIDMNSVPSVKLRQNAMNEQAVSYINRHSYHGSTSFLLRDQDTPRSSQRFTYQTQHVQHNLSPTTDCRNSCVGIYHKVFTWP
uniref:Uncharacterized protein n=1 Tax=Heterorhabditis bacteriophora TaxID=37862 RepID=A0A1I7XK64_HETBA